MSVYLNQRTINRSRCHLPVMFSRWGGMDCFKTRLYDCNKDGFSFRSTFPYLPETEIAIKMKKHENESLASVVWSKPEPSDIEGKPSSYKIGAVFTEKI